MLCYDMTNCHEEGASMKAVLIIQARMGSTRLPGKVLRPLGRTVVLDYVVSRCRTVVDANNTIVATSTLPGDEPIRTWCRSRGVPWFAGSEDDVLARYYQCARPHRPDYVIRVTSDCPFVDNRLGARALALATQCHTDLVAPACDLPRGLWMEVVAFSALERMNVVGQEPRHREHVTYYATEFPGEFSWAVLPIEQELCRPELRITLDTEDDYSLCQTIAAAFPDQLLVPSAQIVSYLASHPEIAALNAHIEQKPVR
ncbi:MAG: NTP transferase domain-containing protein [Pseudomonadota bacterium]